MKIKFAWILGLLAFQVASQEEVITKIDTQHESRITTTEPNSKCISNKNLLKNPEFTFSANQVLPNDWGASQHTGEPSFKTNIDSGVLTITKIATQPWFIFKQKLNAKDWAGKKMRYKANLKLNLNANNLAHAFEPGGGLYLTVYGDNDPLVGGDRLLLDLNLAHEPKLGTTDWINVAIDFTIPEDPTRLIIGFLHQANGHISASNPSLSICEE